MIVFAGGFENSFSVLLWHTWVMTFFTNLVFECSCSLYVTMIQFLFLLHSGSHILALIALVVELPAFSTNLLQEKGCLLLLAGPTWCRVDGREQDWFFATFTKQNWKRQIIASISVVLGIFWDHLHVYWCAQSHREDTIKGESVLAWNLAW